MINQINKLREEGKSIREIAKILDISKSYVHKLMSGQGNSGHIKSNGQSGHNNKVVDSNKVTLSKDT